MERPRADDRSLLERLALADWSEAAQARVDEVFVGPRRAAVVLLLNGDYEYSVFFQRGQDGRWEDAGSSSGRADRAAVADPDVGPDWLLPPDGQ